MYAKMRTYATSAGARASAVGIMRNGLSLLSLRGQAKMRFLEEDGTRFNLVPFPRLMRCLL